MQRAYEIGIHPSEFWGLEMFELIRCIRGHDDRVNSERRFTADMFLLLYNRGLPKKDWLSLKKLGIDGNKQADKRAKMTREEMVEQAKAFKRMVKPIEVNG